MAIGKRRTRTPVACHTALAIAPAVPVTPAHTVTPATPVMHVGPTPAPVHAPPEVAFDDVYVTRINRKWTYFSLHKLGAFGSEVATLSAFFESHWDRLASG